MWNVIVSFVEAHRGAFYAAVTLVVLLLAYKLLTRLLRRYLKARAHKTENILHFLMLWRYGWLGVGLIFLIVSFFGSLVGLGISAAFPGMILGWSLQAPVTGIAAWLMIVLKRPFSIGDRRGHGPPRISSLQGSGSSPRIRGNDSHRPGILPRKRQVPTAFKPQE